MSLKLTFFLVAVAALGLSGCRVETKSDPIPEAEGSGKNALTIRVEPLSRDEMKSAADEAIDKTADAAVQLRNAATTAVENLQTVGRTVTTFTDTMIRNNQSSDDVTTPAN